MFPRLFFFFILACLFLLLPRLLSSWRRSQREALRGHGKDEEMVLDPQCRIYLPKADAIARKGHYFCSEECARLYLSDSGPRADRKD